MVEQSIEDLESYQANPYRVTMSSGAPNVFIGRRHELESINSLFSAAIAVTNANFVTGVGIPGRGLSLYGPRGIGKTAMLYHFRRLVESSSKKEQAKIVIANMDDVRGERYFECILNALQKQLVGQVGKHSLNRSASSTKSVSRNYYEEVCQLLLTLVNDKSTPLGIMLCLDRVDRGIETMPDHVDENLRHLLTIVPILTLSRRSLYAIRQQSRVGIDEGSPFINAMEATQLIGPISVSQAVEWLDLVRLRFGNDKPSVTLDHRAIVNIVGGYPSLLLAIAASLYDTASLDDDKGIDLYQSLQVELEIQSLLQHDAVWGTFRLFDQSFSTSEINLLQEIASAGEEGIPVAPSNARKTLLDAGWIERLRNNSSSADAEFRYCIQSPLLRTYLQDTSLLKSPAAFELSNVYQSSSIIMPTIPTSIEVGETYTIDIELVITQGHLPKRERAILRFLVDNIGQLYSADFLHEKFWPDEDEPVPNKKKRLENCIHRIRNALMTVYGKNSDFIQTVRGEGYLLKKQA